MHEMTELEEYQQWVSSVSAKRGLQWATLGLTAEAGEVSGEVEKWLRKNYGSAAPTEKILDELGDVLWFAAEICNSLDITLDDVIMHNIQKINERTSDRRQV